MTAIAELPLHARTAVWQDGGKTLHRCCSARDRVASTFPLWRASLLQGRNDRIANGTKMTQSRQLLLNQRRPISQDEDAVSQVRGIELRLFLSSLFFLLDLYFGDFKIVSVQKG